LPIVGLVLFAAVTYRSMPVNHHEQDTPRKYYWWSSLRLDSDPLNKHPLPAKPCENKKENCAEWGPEHLNIRPGWLERVLVLSALPAFLAVAVIVAGMSKLGVDEVLTFMVSMPTLIFCWYYFVGWLIERWTYRRQQARGAPLKLT